MQRPARPVVLLREAERDPLYFHCSNTEKVFVDVLFTFMLGNRTINAQFDWELLLTVSSGKWRDSKRRPFRVSIRPLRRLTPILAELVISSSRANFPVNSRPKSYGGYTVGI